MAELVAKFDTSALDRAAGASDAIIYQALRGAMDGILRAFEAKHIKERMSGRPGVMTRTAQLKRSWKLLVVGSKAEDLRGTYANTSRYARMQEYGGTQKPSKAKMLAIPLDAARTAAGIGRFGGPLRAILPAAFPGGTFVRRSKAGNLILFGKTSADAEPVALFVLKTQTVIPPRLGTRDLWRGSQDQHQRILTGFVREANKQLVAASKGGGK